MYWNGTEGKYTTKRFILEREAVHIAEARYPNIQPSLGRVRFINLLAGWRHEKLKAERRGAQKQGAQDVNSQVNQRIEPFGNGAAACIQCRHSIIWKPVVQETNKAESKVDHENKDAGSEGDPKYDLASGSGSPPCLCTWMSRVNHWEPWSEQSD